MTARPMTDGLEPCPFCGGEASRQDLTDEGNEGGSCIACDRCGASSPVHFDRKENLYDSWNRRSTSTTERGMREALQLFRDHYPRGINPWLDEAHSNARAALSGIEGEDEQARGQGRSAPIYTDTKGTTK